MNTFRDTRLWSRPSGSRSAQRASRSRSQPLLTRRSAIGPWTASRRPRIVVGSVACPRSGLPPVVITIEVAKAAALDHWSH